MQKTLGIILSACAKFTSVCMNTLRCKRTVHPSGAVRVPELTAVIPSSASVEFQVQRNDAETTRIFTGYAVIRFGVLMIGEYVNAGTGSRVTISPAVPGAQYRITAWALDSGTRRSATPAVENSTTEEAIENASLRPLLEMPNHMQ